MQSFKISKPFLLKWWPYQYSARCEKNACFIVVFTWLLCQILWRNYQVQYIFLKLISRSRVFSSFMISNKLVSKCWSFQYNTKFGKKSHIFECFDEAFVKNFMKKLPFLIQISKVHVSICYIAELKNLEISATKMTNFSIWYKFRNENFFYNCFNEAFVKTFMIKLLLFNTKFWNSF